MFLSHVWDTTNVIEKVKHNAIFDSLGQYSDQLFVSLAPMRTNSIRSAWYHSHHWLRASPVKRNPVSSPRPSCDNGCPENYTVISSSPPLLQWWLIPSWVHDIILPIWLRANPVKQDPVSSPRPSCDCGCPENYIPKSWFLIWLKTAG